VGAKRIQSKILPVTSLSDKSISEMAKLFEQYYVDISLEQFRSDLFEKTHVFMFTDKKKIVGFSTIFRKHIPSVGPGTFLFSGDTVLMEEYWGSKILQKTFFRYIVESKLRTPALPLYWMLISKGFKTYLMMRRNFAHSFPQQDTKTPETIQKIMDHFYKWKYGEFYNPRTGLITFESSRGAVKGKIADPTKENFEDPEVQYFLGKNPDYKKGVELACVAEIRFSDFLGHIPKYFLKFKKRR